MEYHHFLHLLLNEPKGHLYTCSKGYLRSWGYHRDKKEKLCFCEVSPSRGREFRL
ncbi:unnamed protein product [Gulo gulo]|uniref:Uncharacterized protein n=1 Tax=Gulo gulo TaxID=48420 RepID=A0A9X9MA68_GULGU|nr:unnamed protein product [Gulo gulo]